MRLLTVAALTFSGLAVSAKFIQPNATEVSSLFAELSELPSCATTCIAKGLATTTCNPTDLACLCTDEKYISFSGTCILQNCTIRQALVSQGWQQKACQAPVRNRAAFNRRLGMGLLVVTTFILIVRFLSRWLIQGTSIGWDDWMILVAWAGIVPSTFFVRVMLQHGMGRDIWTVDPSGITLMLKLFYFEQYIYHLIIVSTKISIVLLYLRIFPNTVSKRFQYISWGVIVALVVYFVAFVTVFAVMCRPISYFWVSWDGEHEGECPVDLSTVVYVNSALNIFFDLVVFFLPIPKLISLQVVDTKRKVGVIVVFLVGLFVTACSIVRLCYLAAFGQVPNATWHYNDIAIWTGIEGDIGFICACMPTVAGPTLYFFQKIVGSKIKSSFASTKSSASSHSRMANDKVAVRLPSNDIERDFELVQSLPKHGGIEKTTVMYNQSHHTPSSDDLDMIHQAGDQRIKSQWEI